MEINNTKAKKKSKLVRFLTSPFRILNKIYMASVSSCAAGIENHGGGMVMTASSMAPQPVQLHLPRSFSVISSKRSEEEDIIELIRVSSSTKTNINGGTNYKVHDIKKLEDQGTTGEVCIQSSGVRTRSQSVGKLGKIDEEGSTDFMDVGDFNVISYPRSRTYAAPAGKGMLHE